MVRNISNTSNRPRVFFDGLCHLCSREIDHYRTLSGSENIDFIDITSSTFKARDEGVDPIRVHQTLHAFDRSGTLQLGVDAFLVIWQELPRFRFLVPIARFFLVRAVLKMLYWAFAKFRPLLPKKKCEDSPYCVVDKNV